MNVLRVLSVMIVATMGCSKEEASSPGSPASGKATSPAKSSAVDLDKPASGRPAVSRGAGVESGAEWTLEGEWRVERAGVEMFVFKFYGKEASVRYPSKNDEEIVGPIALFSTNGFVITPQDGRRHIFRYVVADDQVFIGRGESHIIEDTDVFSFKVTTKHTVHVDRSTCTLKNGDKVLQTIECEWDRSVTPPVLSYDSPVPAMPGPKRPRRLYLVGKTLISDTLYGYKAAKVP